MSNGQTAVRRNIYTLDPQGPEVAAIARGIAAMKSRPLTDPTSWIYQANIHATNNPRRLRGWHSCQHGSFFFLSWHRMYVYWFERILRAAAGEPTLAVPYWDYGSSAQRALPQAFRTPANPSNPLYVSQRNRDINAGEPLPESDVNAAAAFRLTRFAARRGRSSFGGWIVPRPQHFGDGFGQLELQPHNTVHTRIGGWMSDPALAARDPIFWLHHANVDRLWKRWLDLGGGRDNPPRTGETAVWWTSVFPFFDERGQPVRMTGADIIDTVRQLGYRYDDEPAPAEPARVEGTEEVMKEKAEAEAHAGTAEEMASGEHPGEAAPERSAGAITLGAAPVRAPVTVLAEDELGEAPSGETAGEEEQIQLTLRQIAFEQYPAVTYEMYLNLPEGQTPDPRSRYYVGNLGFFALTPPAEVSYDITPNVAALRESGEWRREPEVTFVPTLPSARAEEAGEAPPIEPISIGEVIIRTA